MKPDKKMQVGHKKICVFTYTLSFAACIISSNSLIFPRNQILKLQKYHMLLNVELLLKYKWRFP